MTRKGSKATPMPAGVRIALFVEGINILTPRNRDDLEALWKSLCQRVGARSDMVAVHGFTKQQLVLMAPSPEVVVAGRVPFDALVDLTYRESPFDRLVIAFDALPENQAVLPLPGGSCLASERDFLLRELAKSQVLPDRFRESAAALLKYYAGHRGKMRVRTRPPLGDVEAIYMDPCFEAMVMTDASALRRVFSLDRVPASWPKMPFRAQRPDFAFSKLVNEHRDKGPAYLRQPYKERKHAWAHEVVRQAADHSPVFAHPIAHRLGELVR